MSGLFGGGAAAAQPNTVGDLKNDVAIANPPEDSISDLAFNPNQADQKDFLAVSSWDKKVRIYEVLGNGTAEGKHAYEHDGPVFSVDYYKVCYRKRNKHARWGELREIDLKSVRAQG